MKILICGSNGQMGTLITKCVHELGYEIIAVINRDSDFVAELEKKPDICIDFSSPEGLLKLCQHSAQRGIKILSGTTGLNENQCERLKEFSKSIPILHASNFSIGVYALNKLVRIAAEALPSDFDIEIIERHHSAKKDAPSGTARKLLEVIQSVSPHDVLFGRFGEALRMKGEICLHSVRGGDIIGEHEVMFSGNGERLEIIHRATNREIFARGALYAAKIFMNITKAGLYGLSDIL